MADDTDWTKAFGAVGDLLNFGYGVYTDWRDYNYQQNLNRQGQMNWSKEFDYQKQLNRQAQMNWEAQMAFQKMQAQQQQKNFEANRIGNLMKEYADAGLNPFLAAGMGASTAGVVGSGGSAGFSGTHGGANTKLIPARNAEIKMQNAQMAMQLKMTKALNDAQIEKLQADANLSNTQADDMTATRDLRIQKLESEKNLTATQINEIIERTNKLMNEQKLVKAQEILTNEKSTTQQLENAKREIENEILSAVKDTEKARAKAELDKIKTETRIMNSSEVRAWIDSIWAKILPWIK